MAKPRDTKAEYARRKARLAQQGRTVYSVRNEEAKKRGYKSYTQERKIRERFAEVNDPVVSKLLDQLSKGGTNLEKDLPEAVDHLLELDESLYWDWFRVWYSKGKGA